MDKNANNFSVVLDMHFFRLSEMSVKLVDGSIVVIEAKHPERADKEYGCISRHFLHRYRLPSDVDPGSLVSELSDKGILTVTAQKKTHGSSSKHTDLQEVLMDDCDHDEIRYVTDNYDHPQPGVFYTLTRVPGKGAPDTLFEYFRSGCACTNLECNEDNNCCCLNSGPNYRQINGELVLAKNNIDFPVFECNFRCRCFEDIADVEELRRKCRNRCVQFGPCGRLEVFSTPGKGLGIRSTLRIQSGSFICEYAGEVIGLDEAKIRQARNSANGQKNYIFILKEHFNKSEVVTCVDPTNIGNIGRYINHSCQPNSAIVPVRTNTMTPLLCVFAIRDIEKGEEICFDYGSGNGGIYGENRKPCLCGAEACKKWLPFEIV